MMPDIQSRLLEIARLIPALAATAAAYFASILSLALLCGCVFHSNLPASQFFDRVCWEAVWYTMIVLASLIKRYSRPATPIALMLVPPCLLDS